MINSEYANAYKEVLEILKYISKEDCNKISNDKIKFFKENANNSYKFKYNPLKSLDEQNVSRIGKTIIAILYRDYWATDVQRNRILAKEQNDRKKLEEEKRNIYNPNNIFDSNNKN